MRVSTIIIALVIVLTSCSELVVPELMKMRVDCADSLEVYIDGIYYQTGPGVIPVFSNLPNHLRIGSMNVILTPDIPVYMEVLQCLEDQAAGLSKYRTIKTY